MKMDLTDKEREIQDLQQQVIELQRQLAEAQAAISALTPPGKEDATRMDAAWLARFPDENPNPVIRVSREGVILYCNPPAASLRGWRCALHAPLSRPLLDLVEQAVKQGQAVEQDIFLNEKFYWVTVIPIHGEGYLNLYGKDITERKQAETALAESERRQREITRLLELDQARLAAILRHLPVGVWIVDQHGRMTANNPEADRIWAGEAPLLNSIADYQKYLSWDPRSGEPLTPEEYPVAVALRTGESVEPRELKIQRFDGSQGTVLVSAVPIKDRQGVVTGAVGVNVDITQRKRAEEALRESEERFAKAFRSSPDAMVITRLADGLVMEVNEGWKTLFGHEQSEVLGRTTLELGIYVHPEDRTVAIRRLQETGYLRDFEVQVRRKSGEIRQASLSGERIEIGGVDCLLVVIRDITERKQAEAALRISEERFAKAFHSSPDAIIISRMSDGLIIEVNEGWRELFGHDPGEVVGQTSVGLDLFVNPDDRKEAIRRLQETGVVRDFELEIRHQSGQIRLASLSAERMEVNDEAALLTVLRDITERKHAEEALRLSEQRLKRAQEIAHLGSWELDLATNQLIWSDEVYRIFGLQPQGFEATYEAFLEVVHPDDRAAVDNAYSSSLRDGRDSYEIEHRVVRRSSGEVRIVHEKCEHFRNRDGQVVQSIGMVHDITERKQAEEALRQSERRFHSLADSMPQLVWTALPSGKVDYYNRRYQEYREIRRVEDTDWDWAPVLHPDDLQPTVNAWQHALESGEIYQIEHRVRMADGSYRWHLSRGVPMYDAAGQITRWFGTATDIHDLKEAEEQLRDYAERLERSNRELEQFAFMASHDLQEPLRKIEMFGDMLLERAPSLEETERRYLERMRNAAGRMRDMVTGLLQLSRVATQGQPFIRVDLSQVTAEVLSDMEETIQRTGGKVDCEALPVIEGDPVQLRQLMQNLISNAMKYHQPDRPPEIKIYANQPSEKVQICVEDKGLGFEQAESERIFQPFQRLVDRSESEGSGIGLAICRRIVERHAGKITALSKPGRGTTFIVTLPVVHSQSAKSEPGKDANNGTTGTAAGG